MAQPHQHDPACPPHPSSSAAGKSAKRSAPATVDLAPKQRWSAGLDKVFADDVDARPWGDRLWLVWTVSTLEHQKLWIGWLDRAGQRIEATQTELCGMRPLLVPLSDALAVVYCGLDRGRLLPSLALVEPGAPPQLRPLDRLPRVDGVHGVATTTRGEETWLAWSELDPNGWRISLNKINKNKELNHISRIRGRDPHLAHGHGDLRLSWVDDAGVLAANVTDHGPENSARLCRDPRAEQPRAAWTDQGWVTVWQSPVGEGVIRWPHLHCKGIVETPPADRVPALNRGEDQGWEFVALTVDAGGNRWLAGRSSQGFFVQARTAKGWSLRTRLAETGWSGRSRSCALVPDGEGVLFVRGSAAGLRVSALELRTRSEQVVRRPPSPLRIPPRPGKCPHDDLGPLLFGDPHQHTILSDGTGSVEQAYLRARDDLGHDLCAVTDHEGLARGFVGPASWRHLLQVSDALYEPGRFVTLRAYEFTGARLPGPGHKCVYLGASVPETLPAKTGEALRRLLREHDAMAVPHHVGWTGADLDHHDPAYQPVWEICSAHGSYEHADENPIAPRDDVMLPGQFIADALAAGLRFGFVGGTDSHGLRWHHGVCRKADPYRSGLTAIIGEPSRESVLAALRARRCYATSGARIRLALDAEGATMGQELPVPRVKLTVRVAGTAPVKRLSLVQDGQELAAASGGKKVRLDATLQAQRPGSYAYVRVLQHDGEMAWSSPIWLDP